MRPTTPKPSFMRADSVPCTSNTQPRRICFRRGDRPAARRRRMGPPLAIASTMELPRVTSSKPSAASAAATRRTSGIKARQDFSSAAKARATSDGQTEAEGDRASSNVQHVDDGSVRHPSIFFVVSGLRTPGSAGSGRLATAGGSATVWAFSEYSPAERRSHRGNMEHTVR